MEVEKKTLLYKTRKVMKEFSFTYARSSGGWIEIVRAEP